MDVRIRESLKYMSKVIGTLNLNIILDKEIRKAVADKREEEGFLINDINIQRRTMHRITKRFKGYPFAHRQPTHDGHCKLVHGHNWDFEVCLSAQKLDENGFVFDFGKFGGLKKWLEQTFDHTCLINQDDPMLSIFEMLAKQNLLGLRKVDSCSSEGIAKMVFQKMEEILEGEGRISRDFQDRKVRVEWVTVYEDYKNSATYEGNNTLRMSSEVTLQNLKETIRRTER